MKYLKVFETDTDQQNYINGEFDRPNITVVRHSKQSINYIAKLPPPELISFTIDDITYNALEGMTFMEWCESPYNIDGYIYEPISSSEYRVATSGGDYISINRTWVDASDIIQKDGKYIVGLYKLITFYLTNGYASTSTYTAEMGMSFYDFVNSKYNDGLLTISANNIYYNNCYFHSLNPTDIIENGETYFYSVSGGSA